MTAEREPTHEIDLRVNGEDVRVRTRARTSLADLLRDELRLTGTHLSCEEGVCGSCTVLVDGRSARSCLTLALQAEGSEVVTVEGLEGKDGTRAALQDAFLRHHAFQCGFCTPGFLVLATEIVDEARAGVEFDHDALVRRLAANLCRCTGYEPIVAAVEEVLADGR